MVSEAQAVRTSPRERRAETGHWGVHLLRVGEEAEGPEIEPSGERGDGELASGTRGPGPPLGGSLVRVAVDAGPGVK